MADTVELTQDQKAALARFKGEENAPEVKTPEQITAEKEEADKQAALQAEEEKKKQQPAHSIPELTEEQLLEVVAKRTGRKISSWDDLKPAPEEVDKEKEAEKREADKLTFGLKKGLFNKNQYESFIADKQNPVALVYKAELEEAKKDDPTWDEEKEKEFKEEFDARFGLDLDKTSPRHKRGQKQIGVVAENILRQTYPGILNLDSEYSGYETQVQSKAAQQKKIIEAAPIYKKDVEDAVSSIKEIEIAFDENEKHKIKMPDEVVQSIQETLMDKDFVSSQVLKGYTKEEIKSIAYNMAVSQNIGLLSREAAKLHRLAHEKGVRGIPVGGTLEKKENNLDGLSDKQKTAIEFFKPVTATTTAN